MLDAQVVVNLLPELGVGGFGETWRLGWGKIQVRRGKVPTKGLAELWACIRAMSARNGQMRVLQTAARRRLGCARRHANSIALLRWRSSNTASSPLCVRVWVNFVITLVLSVFLVRNSR